MEGKGDLFGLCDYLAVWNHDRFNARLERDPTLTKMRALSEFGM